MDGGGYDRRMPLQYHGGISVRYAGDDDGASFIYPVPEAAYCMAGTSELRAGHCLFAFVSVDEMSGSICGEEGTAAHRPDRYCRMDGRILCGSVCG